MSIEEKKFHNAKKAISFLENLTLGTNDTIVFRGHNNQNYRLVNTLQRQGYTNHAEWNSYIDDILKEFRVGLEKLQVKSFNNENRFEALEFARHHGIPTPCLDFSYSPYIALFFAFNEVKFNYKDKKTNYSVIYALNIDNLAFDSEADLKQFKSPKDSFFKDNFPANKLQFIPYPGKGNTRMQKQLGALLYDTRNYEKLKVRDLEEYILKIEEPNIDENGITKKGTPTLYKISINHSCIENIFQRLELMNITGGNLYGNADGVALDIKNSYNYNPKFNLLRDIFSPEFNYD